MMRSVTVPSKGSPTVWVARCAKPDHVRADAEAAVREFAAFKQKSVEAGLLFGQRLIAVRDELEPRQFKGWLEAAFPELSRSQAYRYMDLAANLPAGICPKLGHMPLSSAYELTASS